MVGMEHGSLCRTALHSWAAYCELGLRLLSWDIAELYVYCTRQRLVFSIIWKMGVEDRQTDTHTHTNYHMPLAHAHQGIIKAAYPLKKEWRSCQQHHEKIYGISDSTAI